MLLAVDVQNQKALRERGCRLEDFGLDVRGFQHILFQSLDRLIPDNELLPLMESQIGKEQPDFMALDKEGRLYIFELKAWETEKENILQVLRYGQLFGGYSYDELNELYKKCFPEVKSLATDHESRFDGDLDQSEYNREQVFVVMTNGIDFRTRKAIRYWRRQGLDVRPWIYRVYKGHDRELLVEISSFAAEDNPYEDLVERFYVVNTNFNYHHEDHEAMLNENKAAVYLTPWKKRIESLGQGDRVFLYQPTVGIVASGIATGELKITPRHRDSGKPDEEYSMPLTSFHDLNKPISAAEVKEITGINYSFMQTLFSIKPEGGEKLFNMAKKR